MLAHAPVCEARPNSPLRKQPADMVTRPGKAGKGGPCVPRADLGRGLLKNPRSGKRHALAEDAMGRPGHVWRGAVPIPFASRLGACQLGDGLQLQAALRGRVARTPVYGELREQRRV